MEYENEFFGKLVLKVVRDENNARSEYVDWAVVDPDKTVNRERKIEDGDFLQVFDGSGRLLLNKTIYRDYDTLYDHRHGMQLYEGMRVSWLPKGIDTGFWRNQFNNQARARLLKIKRDE